MHLSASSLASPSLETHSVVVNDLGNDGELSGERSVVDEDDSADLDESLEGGRSLNLFRQRFQSVIRD